MTKSIEERSLEWLKTGNRGVSSNTIHDYFCNDGKANDPGYPHDSADFGRCQKLIELIPEWRDRLHELGALPGLNGQVWAALAKEWAICEELYRDGLLSTLDGHLKMIVVPIEDKSGQVVRLGKGMSMTIPDVGAEHLKRSEYIVNKINDIAEKTGVPPMKVYNAAMEKLNKKKGKSMSADMEDAEQARVDAEKAKEPEFDMGHNSDGEACDVGGVAGKRLKSFLDWIERLEEEKKGLSDDIKEIYMEAKRTGFDVKTMRKILKLRKMETDKRRKEDELLALYKAAIGLE